MRRELLTAMALAASVAAAGPAASDPRLAGSWRAVEAEQDGRPAPELVGHVLTVEADRFQIAAPDGAPIYQGAWSADPAATPATIDFVNEAGASAGVTWLGVYAIDGSRLSIVDNAPDPTRPRPTVLAAPDGSGYVRVVFEPAG
jgi:uncharacterized protein (TIGR03067 family)